MKLANLDDRAVLVVDDTVVDVATASDGRFGPDPMAVYEQWDEVVAWAGALANRRPESAVLHLRAATRLFERVRDDGPAYADFIDRWRTVVNGVLARLNNPRQAEEFESRVSALFPTPPRRPMPGRKPTPMKMSSGCARHSIRCRPSIAPCLPCAKSKGFLTSKSPRQPESRPQRPFRRPY